MRKVFSLMLAVALTSLSNSIAYASDTTAPTLVEWGNTVGLKDISEKDVKLVVNFVLSDDSNIKLPSLILKSRTTSQTSGLAEVKQMGASGRLKSFEASVVIKVGQAPRDWEWVLYPLVDEFGNTDNKFGPVGVQNHVVTIFNSTYTWRNQSCENNLIIYNRKVEQILNLEKQYPQFKDDFDLLRLKMKTPLEVQSNQLCLGAEPSLPSLGDNYDAVIAKIEAFNTAKATAEAELRARQAAELKAKQDAEAAAKAAAAKKMTITCVKGKTIKKVTAVKPKCPSGYKKK